MGLGEKKRLANNIALEVYFAEQEEF